MRHYFLEVTTNKKLVFCKQMYMLLRNNQITFVPFYDLRLAFVPCVIKILLTNLMLEI